jgi:hypothetical protein
VYTAYLHAIASMLWMVLWLVGPPDGYWLTHLGIFSTAVFFRYLCSLGNYVEGDHAVARTREASGILICSGSNPGGAVGC